MRELTASELVALGERFNVAVDLEAGERLRDGVNDLLEEAAGPLDGERLGEDRGGDTRTVPENATDVGVRTAGAADGAPDVGEGGPPADREWWRPEDDPHNAVAVYCSVRTTDSGPLAGYEVGVKDLVAVAGMPMACGSAVMDGYVPRTDATVVRRLLDSGAAVVAKTNLDEFAGSGRGTTSHFGPVRNPHDRDRTAGGSSGGSAVAVATGEVDVALGTDTGGSVRIPAAYCGVVGLKPTYGLVPMTGVVENSYTLDHVGPLARSVEDCAAALDSLAGADDRDAASLQAAGRTEYRVGGYAAAAADPTDLASARIAVVEEGLDDGVDPAVVDRTEAAIDRIEDAGATIERIGLPAFADARGIVKVLSVAEGANHWRDRGVHYRRDGRLDPDYQAELARRSKASSAELGDYYKTGLLAGAHLIEERDGRPYVRATHAREATRARVDEALDRADALLTPTMAEVAPPIDAATERDLGHGFGYNTRPANLTRHPAISLPNGTVDGLPVGLQLIGGAFRDADLLAVAVAVASLNE